NLRSQPGNSRWVRCANRNAVLVLSVTAEIGTRRIVLTTAFICCCPPPASNLKIHPPRLVKSVKSVMKNSTELGSIGGLRRGRLDHVEVDSGLAGRDHFGLGRNSISQPESRGNPPRTSHWTQILHDVQS